MEKFAILGHPVAHSLSPVMHEANFKSLGYDGSYERFDVVPEDLASTVERLKSEGYRGLNITVPHKIHVIDSLTAIDESVRRYGACNTVRFEKDGGTTGFNTDVIGFIEGLNANGCPLQGKRVAILGCGGAGSALAFACCYEGADAVTVCARNEAKAKDLADKLEKLGTAAKISIAVSQSANKGADDPWTKSATEADLVVNATPLGIREGDPSALPSEAFHPGQFVYDIVPVKTFPPTAAAARKAGATAFDGLQFLAGQGAAAFKLWTGLEADKLSMLKAIGG